MDKALRTEFSRVFLIEKLPEPLTPMSSHLQLFDNYIENTRIRLRNIRVPETREWTHKLQQRFPIGEEINGISNVSEMILNDAEYQIFERFEGREIRKNRYFHEFDGLSFDLDIYLGSLWGLCTAKVEFRNGDEMERFEPPTFAVFEVTGSAFFYGEVLVTKTIEHVREEVDRIGSSSPQIRENED